MKSKFFGLSAKLALAILAVGTTLTSCYDSENVDIIAPENPAPAKYYIAGNITDAATGEALPGATVKMDGADVTVNGSYFEIEVAGGAAYEFTVDVNGYYTATRKIFMPTIADGGVSVGNADFALVSILAEDLLELDGPQALASVDEAKVALDMHKETILAALNGIEGMNMDDVELTVDEWGNIRLVAPASFEAREIGADYDVTLPFYHGFVSTVDQSADDIFTKAVTEGNIWNASAAAVLNRDYGFTIEMRTETLPGVAGAAINGYTFVVYFTNKILSFGGYEGTATYQGEWYVIPTYEGHDNHDLHDILHGNHNGAGGGNTNFGF